MTAKQKIGLVTAFGMLLLTTGCGGSDTFISYGGKSGGQIAFCISEKPNCGDPGASLRILQVDQIDPSGKSTQIMWQAKSPSGWGSAYTVGKIVYGVPPVGWTVVTPANALQPGKRYRVNNQFYFSLTSNGLIIPELPPKGK